MRRFWIAISAVAAVIAAGCESSSKPTSPSSVGPLFPQTFTLSGAVTEVVGAGVVPVNGALVMEIRSQRQTTSGMDGHYSIEGLRAGVGVITTHKFGYVSSASNVEITADATLNVRVMRSQNKSYIISGVVFEITSSGRRAVEGVELYCESCESPEGYSYTASDTRGHYQFAWATNGSHEIQVWKDGYALARRDGSYGVLTEYVVATVNGDTQFDIELVRR